MYMYIFATYGGMVWCGVIVHRSRGQGKGWLEQGRARWVVLGGQKKKKQQRKRPEL